MLIFIHLLPEINPSGFLILSCSITCESNKIIEYITFSRLFFLRVKLNSQSHNFSHHCSIPALIVFFISLQHFKSPLTILEEFLEFFASTCYFRRSASNSNFFQTFWSCWPYAGRAAKASCNHLFLMLGFSSWSWLTWPWSWKMRAMEWPMFLASLWILIAGLAFALFILTLIVCVWSHHMNMVKMGSILMQSRFSSRSGWIWAELMASWSLDMTLDYFLVSFDLFDFSLKSFGQVIFLFFKCKDYILFFLDFHWQLMLQMTTIKMDYFFSVTILSRVQLIVFIKYSPSASS